MSECPILPACNPRLVHASMLYPPCLHLLGKRNPLTERTQTPLPLDNRRLHGRRCLSHWPAIESIPRWRLRLVSISIPSRRAMHGRAFRIRTVTAVTTRPERRRGARRYAPHAIVGCIHGVGAARSRARRGRTACWALAVALATSAARVGGAFVSCGRRLSCVFV